jgi:phage terminase large subunit
VNLNREAAMYKYRETKDGILLDEPVKANDHALDALRYALHTHCGPRGGGGGMAGLDVDP